MFIDNWIGNEGVCALAAVLDAMQLDTLILARTFIPPATLRVDACCV